jgi:uncharacterized membrane protein
MDRARLTAFTDGVLAIIVTIMVLELKPPHDTSMAALLHQWPVFLSYILSFVYVGIYWNNHHHFFQLVRSVDGVVLWANLHLLFWLSLVPFTTAWMGENQFAPLPTAVYGASLLMPALAWVLLQRVLLWREGSDSRLRRALGADLKGKLSPLVYLAGVGLAFVDTRLAGLAYVAVALIWLVPDRRMEHAAKER